MKYSSKLIKILKKKAPKIIYEMPEGDASVLMGMIRKYNNSHSKAGSYNPAFHNTNLMDLLCDKVKLGK